MSCNYLGLCRHFRRIHIADCSWLKHKPLQYLQRANVSNSRLMRWPHFCSHPLLERMLLRVQITLKQIFSVIISLISAVLLCGEGVCVYISKLFSQNCILCLRQGGIVIIQFVTMSLLRYLSRFTIFACTLRWSLAVM